MAFHIIGDEDTVLGFRFAGVTGDCVENADQAQAAFRRAVDEAGCRILLLTEAVEDMIEADVTAHRLESEAPFIVTVEDIWGPRGERPALTDLIQEAVGIRIVKDED